MFDKELKVAKSLAREMGKIQLNSFRKDIKVIRKSPKEFVTNIDMECQQLSNEILTKEFNHEIMSEEKIEDSPISSDLFWILDPIDGTHNYISGLPSFGVSIALASKDDFLLGVIYLPYFDELFVGVKSEGATMNNNPISVSNNTEIEKSMINYDNQFHLDDSIFDNYMKIYPNTFTMRVTGSSIYDMSLISRGIIDARIWNKTKPYDFSAGVVIIQEAGGKVTEFDGSPVNIKSESIIASNGKINRDIANLLL